MADADSTICDIAAERTKRRLLAVLDYDGIPECERIKHLMNKCNISRYMAKRALNGTLPKYANIVFRMADGLDICFVWLQAGEFWKFHSRTALIQMVMIDGKKMDEVEWLVKTIANEIPGEPTYAYWGGCYPSGKKFTVIDLVIFEQYRRLTKWEKDKHLRLVLRLNNNDAKANRMLEMAARGQITKEQLFAAM